MQSRFIRPDGHLWNECLSQMPHDFYHMPGHVQLWASQERGEPLAFVAEQGAHRLFVPLIVRPIDTDRTTKNRLYDSTSPYGYPSPLLTSAENEERRVEFLERAIEMLLSSLRERGVVSAFLRLHPLLPLPLEPFRRHGTLVHHGETVFADLMLPEEELWHQTRKQHRRKTNGARRNGYIAEIDHEWSCFEDFFEIYTETMERVNAADYYFFPRQYFRDLKNALKDALHLCVIRINGSVACASLFTEVCGIVQAHLTGARSEYDKDAPTILINDFIRSWAKQRGNYAFHLGGGKGGGSDSLFRFKAGYSKLRSDFYTWRAVVDVDEYEALVRGWEQLAGMELDSHHGYFPAYRTSPLRSDGPAPAAESVSAL